MRVEDAGGEGGVYEEELFKKRVHNPGHVFCRRRGRPACSLEVLEKFCDFDFDSFSEDSSLLLEQFTELTELFLFQGSSLRKVLL